MKLNLLAMQALDYGLTENDIPLVPWYSDGYQLFTAKFTTDKQQGYQQIWLANSSREVAGMRALDAGHLPNLFSRAASLIRGLPSSTGQELMTLVRDSLTEEMRAETANSVPGARFPISTFAFETRFESGLVLHGTELSSSEYELVGFEQN
ncbi:hypothetical protein [Lacticaseibacillus salsurivasis]|uniref:hypothetical protein n=1 Tax=Lacticaseibacillus salsurivasis TaxID=3081441 RepID=UPI0030C7414C